MDLRPFNVATKIEDVNTVMYEGCGGIFAKTCGHDPLADKWTEEDVLARCGEFQVEAPFKFDQRICRDCAVRLGLIW